ncbi:glucarate dehydratase [Actinopolymorpha cephalotaxi]|uniref:glucarate dehydratase n=1 Tax=Actinopolymorpha cephalotaxi TaxID=504797 RepID=A0A1I2R6K4_9ACTN|nr:enolase C-terminal domain-like protein [Actinopolymorpha cephalotaxi]NYH82354.1 glucarate dehydratase [Actinopolymorpha cephalotaxi]SFG35683.1 glucarate dehydratase [Actinopolymorpha cephalotaxi]
MRVADIDVWVVNVPLTTTFASSFEAKAGTTRTVIRVRDDDGREGWGETMHGRPTAALVERIRDQFVGVDPRASATIRRTCAMVPFFYGYLGYCALAGLEMAFLDLAGKASGVPLHLQLGGAVRDTIPLTGLLTRGAAGDVPRADQPAVLADKAAEIVAEHGFTAVKFKGSTDARFDVSVMEALRAKLPGTALRVDPNAVWSVPESVWAGRRLDALDLEYLEDPCAGLEGMAQVRAQIATPLCTNMCVVREEDLAPAVRMGAVDIIHADVHKWGGVGPTMNLAATCRAFGLGLNFHSGGELGISTACHLQVAAALDRLDHAVDAMYYLADGDVLTERIELSHGSLPVPQGAGLGVDVDLDRVLHYARRNEKEGDHTP